MLVLEIVLILLDIAHQIHGVLKNKIHDKYVDYKKNFPTDAHHQIFFDFFSQKGPTIPKSKKNLYFV